MCIILKQIKIFKFPTMTEWLIPHDKSTIVKIDRRAGHINISQKKKDVLSKELSILCLLEG